MEAKHTIGKKRMRIFNSREHKAFNPRLTLLEKDKIVKSPSLLSPELMSSKQALDPTLNRSEGIKIKRKALLLSSEHTSLTPKLPLLEGKKGETVDSGSTRQLNEADNAIDEEDKVNATSEIPNLPLYDEVDNLPTSQINEADDAIGQEGKMSVVAEYAELHSSDNRVSSPINDIETASSNTATDIQLITLPNGIKLAFGHIVALAGDYYGVPEEPIIHTTKKGKDTRKCRRERFLTSHGTLAHAEYAKVKRESDELISIMKEEEQLIDEAIKNSREVSEKEFGDLNAKYDRVLGGSWIMGVPMKFGRMMKLAVQNFDHFQPFAREAYEIGHELALEKAREASRANKEIRKGIVHEAYSIEAFACHFLTDSFASGHMRYVWHFFFLGFHVCT